MAGAIARPTYGVLAALTLFGGLANAAVEPEVYGFVDLPLAQCDVGSATGEAQGEVLERQVQIGNSQKPMLDEFMALSKKSTATGNEPMYSGLSQQDNVRASELSQKMKENNFLESVEDAYGRDLSVLSRVFEDVDAEYKTGQVPKFDDADPKSEANLIYGYALALRQKYGVADVDPKPTPDQSRCSVDLALWRRLAEPIAQMDRIAQPLAMMKAKIEALRAKYGVATLATLDARAMSAADLADYEAMHSQFDSMNRVVTFIRDVEDLRLILRASGIRRQAYIHDLLVAGTDIKIGATLDGRIASAEFDQDTITALRFQDMLSSMFPSDMEKMNARLAGTLAGSAH